MGHTCSVSFRCNCYYSVENNINPTVFIAKFANICTIQPGNMLRVFASSTLKIIPPTASPSRASKKTAKSNHQSIIAT